MSLNLNNLTQLEIEEAFDMRKVREDINEQVLVYADTICKYESKIAEIMSTYVSDIDTGDTKEVMIILLSILGNSKAGIQLGKTRDGNIRPLSTGMQKINARDIPFNVFIKTFYKDIFIQDTFKHKALDFAMDIAVELDEIFFDIIKRVEMVEDGQFRTLTYIRSELLFDENTSLRAHYERFRLPLIEKPIDWKVNQNGGYHLHRRKVTTNRGDSEQPESVLNVLNKLQAQPFIHKQNNELEYEFLINKFKSDGNNDGLAHEKAKAIMLTCEETYEAIGDRPIYFEWRMDARGRMYSTGYDINIQGNKAKKGALRPKLW